MKIYEYLNYDDYVQAQTEANEVKLKLVWVQEPTIKLIYNTVGNLKNIKKILCHGTRNGAEQKLFRKYFPKAEVLGTEISKTATLFPDTIQWDFQKQKTDWVEYWDLIYSNALDHTTDLVKTLRTWKQQLHRYGVLFIEYSFHNRTTRSDPLEITKEEFKLALIQAELICVAIHNTYGMKKIPTKLYEIILAS